MIQERFQTDGKKAGGNTLHMIRLIRWITALSIVPLLTLFAPADSAAREPAPEKRVYKTRHILSQPPDIDGKGDDPAWDVVEWSGDFTQLDPEDGGEPTQQTAFKILFDDHNLYVLIRAYDTEPDQITSRVTRRDDFDNDWVEVHFDSYHDKRTAFSFTLTASGGRGDEGHIERRQRLGLELGTPYGSARPPSTKRDGLPRCAYP